MDSEQSSNRTYEQTGASHSPDPGAETPSPGHAPQTTASAFSECASRRWERRLKRSPCFTQQTSSGLEGGVRTNCENRNFQRTLPESQYRMHQSASASRLPHGCWPLFHLCFQKVPITSLSDYRIQLRRSTPGFERPRTLQRHTGNGRFTTPAHDVSRASQNIHPAWLSCRAT